MDIRAVDENYSVAGQIEVEDIAVIAAAGFKTLMCHRPDEESFGQPAHAGIFAAAKAKGMTCHFIPVTSAGLTHENVDAMKLALSDAERPILAYCRSGARSTMIYQIATR
ncbi:MAG: TIGR01244 family sulfur transferase [Rhizobiaceae bacterium]